MSGKVLPCFSPDQFFSIQECELHGHTVHNRHFNGCLECFEVQRKLLATKRQREIREQAQRVAELMSVLDNAVRELGRDISNGNEQF